MQIERDIQIAAPAERVWALITEAEHIGRWFADSGAEVDLRPGGALTMHWAEYGSSHARIVDVEPHTRFSYRWVPYPSAGAEPTDGNSTLVEFTLEPEAGGTRLRVVESGFEQLDRTPAAIDEAVEGNTEGWQKELAELREYAERVAA
jgi:uncharacterized protein YndB with AHSA1/START domain